MKKILIFIFTIISMGVSFFVVEGLGTVASPDQETRTVNYDDNLLFDQDFLEEFEEYNLQEFENDIEIIAKKNFDISVLNELDLVGLDENEQTFTVRYEINYIDSDTTIFLTVIIEGSDEIPVIETIPGLVTYNLAGESDIMFVVDGEYLWLSDMSEVGLLDNVGWFSSIVNTINNAVNNAVTAIVDVIAPILAPAVRIATNVAVTILGAELAAALGAWVLNMSIDEQGIYHANFDCWQQYFGYTDLYDIIFNAATSMRRAKFPFDVDNDKIDDYIFWVWKGDYLNLGAGAELGIYKRWEHSDNFWVVDKSLAMKMTLKLDHKGKNIINWQPMQKQWWITGFDYKTKNVKRDDLTASFSVTFSDTVMYNSFKGKYSIYSSGWTFNGYTTSFTF